MDRKTFRKLVIDNDYSWGIIANKIYKPKYEASAKTKQDTIDFVESQFALYDRFKKFYKYYGYSQRGDQLAYKSWVANKIKECTEDGKFALNWDRTDCDHYNVVSSKIIDTNTPLVEILAGIDEAYDNAEGRTSHWFSKPSKAVEEKARDYALEAFENGHPSTIVYN